MRELVIPDVRHRPSFLASHGEWGEERQPGTGLEAERGDDVTTEAGFAAWVTRLLASEHTPPHPGYVTCSYRWILVDGEYAGAIALRHELNDFLLAGGGHIGYGIRPSRRRQGLATWALGECLGLAKTRGMARVLVTCDDGNIGSARTIEKCGGVLEDLRAGADGVLVRRYWIETSR